MPRRLRAFGAILALAVVASTGFAASAVAQTLPGEPAAPGDVGPGAATSGRVRRRTRWVGGPSR